MQRFVVLALSMALAVQPASAQVWTRDWPQAGDTVRVWLDGLGTSRPQLVYRRRAGDTLYFVQRSAVSRELTEQPIPLGFIARLEMQGVPRASAGRAFGGTLLGFVLGVGAGALVGDLLEGKCHADAATCDDPNDYSQGMGPVLGGLVGGPVGGIVGFSLGHRAYTPWRTVYPPAR